jgi:predicted nucleic acid-binding protein
VNLVDTSVWIEHFKKKNSKLTLLLLDGKVATHEFILGELSLGHFETKDRPIIFERLSFLNKIATSSHEEVIQFSRQHKLAGKGIGWIDCHLLHSSIKHSVPLVTLDRKLEALYKKLSK